MDAQTKSLQNWIREQKSIQYIVAKTKEIVPLNLSGAEKGALRGSKGDCFEMKIDKRQIEFCGGSGYKLERRFLISPRHQNPEKYENRADAQENSCLLVLFWSNLNLWPFSIIFSGSFFKAGWVPNLNRLPNFPILNLGTHFKLKHEAKKGNEQESRGPVPRS